MWVLRQDAARFAGATGEAPPLTGVGELMEENGRIRQSTEGIPEREPQTVEEELRRELAQARREAEEYRDLYLRVLADKENARKRLERLYEERLGEAKRELLRQVISVADNLERALAHQEAREGLVEGIRLTYRQIQDLLRSYGVEPVQALGQPFNPAEHEAVALVEGPEPPGTVVAEELRGYRQGEYLLRPAHVRVTAGEPD